MELTPELLGTGAVGALVILSAIGNYLRKLKEKPRRSDPVIAGVGIELGNREQMERLIAAVQGISAALAEKQQSAIEAKLEELVERIDDITPPKRR